ncbi:MAG: Gfo/Idh/MocA family oxidoreductase [Paenibacillaceae bacterium]|nr:Gfo/Idh/MocA family oxidoreductase [Paenibacillaceae bacterium]
MNHPITAVLIGAGQRGMDAYGAYALEYPDEIRFVAVADANPARRDEFREAHGVAAEHCYAGWEQLLEGPRLADAILICTQDRMHYEPAIKAFEKGYHVLLEKPMSIDPLECIAMGEVAAKHNRVFAICHVLRYTKFFSEIKRLVSEGVVGRLVTLQQTENVSPGHQAHSFVRGNWRNSQTSSPMILAKSCHDMDIMLWLVGADCTKVSSFGSLTHFRQENAPEGAPERCLDGCPATDTCLYYAPRAYLERKDWVGDVLRRVVSGDTSDEGVIRALREGPYGRCVYRCDNNVVDHQVVNLEFANEVTATFTMTAFTRNGGREVRLMGTKGELRACSVKNEIEISDFATGKTTVVPIDAPQAGHGGGDSGIMRDFIRIVRSEGREAGRTGANISVQSHLMAFAAEKSRVEQSTILLSDYISELKESLTI